MRSLKICKNSGESNKMEEWGSACNQRELINEFHDNLHKMIAESAIKKIPEDLIAHCTTSIVSNRNRIHAIALTVSLQ